MLNPEFRLLDPEPEQMERLAHLSGNENPMPLPWSYSLLTLEPGTREEFFRQLTARLATPGDHPLAEINGHIRALAQAMDIKLPEPKLFGFPESFLFRIIGHLTAPCILMLGILDQEGIWAGGLAGVSRGGLDFFTTFQFLWADEPELAAKQTLGDFNEIAHAAGRSFSRPVGGLFITRDEFNLLNQHGWAPQYLDQCVQQGTAFYQWPY
jgi:hypothetical protein